MTKTIPETCDIWDTDYYSDNWEPESMTIIVTWQLRVTLDSIRNSCDVYWLKVANKLLQKSTFIFDFWLLLVQPDPTTCHATFCKNSHQKGSQFSSNIFPFSLHNIYFSVLRFHYFLKIIDIFLQNIPLFSLQNYTFSPLKHFKSWLDFQPSGRNVSSRPDRWRLK